jgi:translation initiation factor 5A
MSDSEEHHFESKADAGASKTYPQQAGTVRKNGYIVIKNRPCKVRILLLAFPLSPYCR